jgi:hypothetical protein
VGKADEVMENTFDRLTYREAEMRSLHANKILAVVALGVSFWIAGVPTANAQTTPVFNITSTFNFIQDQGANDGGFLTGVSDIFGIFVTPVGTQPTPSVDGTSVTATQGSFKTGVPYFFSTANPTEFVQALPFPAFSNLTGSWTFQLTNPTINGGLPVASSPTQPLITTTPPHFVNSVLLTPDGPTPTLQWALPSGYTPNAQSIFIYDKSRQTPNGLAPLVKTFNSIGVGPSTAPQTWTVPQGVFGTAPGELSPTNNYIVSIQLDQVNPTTNILDGRSRTYVNFNISALTAPVYVPTIAANGAYQFDIGVTTGQIYPIDPSIATGFNYTIGAGNPDFATVLLPAVQGNDPYTITWDNGQETAKVLGGDVFNFLSTDPLGVSAFTVTGIDPADRVDPSSGTDFVTDLTFVGNGQFTGTMTPITASIPEPSTWALMLLGFAGLGFAGYRKSMAG